MMAKRSNLGKPKLNKVLMFEKALPALAVRMEQGDAKYGENNWKKGFDYTVLIDSLMRHLISFRSGEDMDTDEQTPSAHVDAIVWNAMVLAEQFHKKTGRDNRNV